MDKMYKFPSINQFRHVIKNVSHKARYAGEDENGQPIYNASATLPTLRFRGTVKIHGTCAAVCYNRKDNSFYFQSRERVLSLTQDNSQFCLLSMGKKHIYREILDKLPVSDDIVTICFYGEWAGQGIQSNVAVSTLPKMFVIFGIKLIDGEGKSTWLEFSDIEIDYPNDNIYSIHMFPVHIIDIDFNFPTLSQNTLIEETLKVEEECPVGKYFGVSGIGEGIVYSCITEGYEGSDFMFKSKGSLHSVSKVTKLNSIDVEKVASIKNFVDDTVTEARLNQGIDVIKKEMMLPLEMQSLGEYLRWIYNDIIKEETDTIVASAIDPKQLGKHIANKARPWYINRINSSV